MHLESHWRCPGGIDDEYVLDVCFACVQGLHCLLHGRSHNVLLRLQEAEAAKKAAEAKVQELQVSHAGSQSDAAECAKEQKALEVQLDGSRLAHGNAQDTLRSCEDITKSLERGKVGALLFVSMMTPLTIVCLSGQAGCKLSLAARLCRRHQSALLWPAACAERGRGRARGAEGGAEGAARRQQEPAEGAEGAVRRAGRAGRMQRRARQRAAHRGV